MGLIYEEIKLVGTIKSKSINALFDSGSDINAIRRKFSDDETIESIGFHTYRKKIYEIEFGDNSRKSRDGVVFNNIVFKSQSLKNPIFVVIDEAREDMILGAPFMQDMGLMLDFISDKIYLGPK